MLSSRDLAFHITQGFDDAAATDPHQIAPNGARLVGKAQCLANWQALASATGTWFEREEVFVVGERVVVRWRYCWGDDDTRSMRGVSG